MVIDRRIEVWEVDSEYSDSVSGAKALVEHLVGLGHERIAVLAGPANTSTAGDRVTGYCMALAEVGIPIDPCLIRRGEYRIASMDAVACDFSWRPDDVFEQAADGDARHVERVVKTWADLDDLKPPPPLADQLSDLERYIARGLLVGAIKG